MARQHCQRPRFSENPRAYCAASPLLPLVWLSYVLPAGRTRGGADNRAAGELPSPDPLFESDREVVTPSRKVSLLPALEAIAGRWVEWRWPFETGQGRTIVGWGYRKSGRRAMAVAAQKKGRFVLLEDGFLRSVRRQDPPMGLNLDDGGIYYDARSDSRLFKLARRPLSDAERVRARALAEQWRRLGLSKYNGSRDYAGPLPARYVLVVDQVGNDLSIRHGEGSPESFEKMLEAALAHDPDVSVVVKLHPDSSANPKKSHFDRTKLADHPRIQVIADTSHVSELVARSEAVYAVTSQVGFEGLLHAKPVQVFGMPFYAGWGLTQDRLPRPEGREDIALEQLVHAALVDYPRYYDPVRAEPCDAEEAFALVGHNRSLRGALPPVLYAHGFSKWKRPFIADFLAGSDVRFVKTIDEVPEGETLVLWGRRPIPDARDDIAVLRIEDGFLRSSGLGANLVRPLSLVLDDVGIYYDATQPSRLERLLEHSDYGEAERRRAAALRHAIVDLRLNKYNLGGTAWRRPETARDVLLVVGQVEQDASIKYGAAGVRTNRDLLETVRRENPDAYILYKPHPDVLAGLRAAGTDTQAAAPYDELVGAVSPDALFAAVDRVHTMTSQMGFEALLRGVPVTCHGMPFYAGWGLTEDRVSCARRTRTLSIDELVHAALIDYPRYFSPRGAMFAEPEAILVELADLAAKGPERRPWPRRLLYWGITRWLKARPR